MRRLNPTNYRSTCGFNRGADLRDRAVCLCLTNQRRALGFGQSGVSVDPLDSVFVFLFIPAYLPPYDEICVSDQRVVMYRTEINGKFRL